MSQSTDINGIADADIVTAGGRGHLVQYDTTSNRRIDHATSGSETIIGMNTNNDATAAADTVQMVYAGVATGVAGEALDAFDEVYALSDSEFGKYVAGSGNTCVGRFIPTLKAGGTNLPSVIAAQTIRVYLYARKEIRNDASGTLKAVYDFAVDGGVIGSIASGAFFPALAVVNQSAFQVKTTCTSATDAGTMAVTSTDITIDAAVAISLGTDWDAGLREGDHQVDTSTTWEVAVLRQELSFVIAVENFTAGKIVAFANYWIGE